MARPQDDLVAKSLRFAITGSTETNAGAFTELRTAIVRAGGPDVEPLFVPTYASLYETVCAGLVELAWAPPLVAVDLQRVQAATPAAATMRSGGSAYYAALLTRADSDVAHVGQIGGTRVGWVSKLSAAGYVVPRYYLRSLGMHLDDLFSDESFHATHAKLAEALASKTIDVAATYASLHGGSFLPAPTRVPVRVLATAGPIPGDVVVVSSRVDEAQKTTLAAALARCTFPEEGPLQRLMSVERLVPAPRGHLTPLSRWTARAEHGAFRTTRPSDAPRSTRGST
jgi:ABC-type phosphate/phosphonate transport system substrate-binding protein